MKSIEIKGKQQKYRIQKANDPNNTDIIYQRETMLKLPDKLFEYKFQQELINKLYLDIDHSNNFIYKKELIREIKQKLNSYNLQDNNNNKFQHSPNANISFESTVEKIVACKLKCYYCNCNMKLFYKIVRDMQQWTLDRIDNNLPHKLDNIVISCLKCNLQRRCKDKEKFLFTKKLSIIKND